MNDPYIIRFVNEQVRPLAETLRGLKARIDACMTQWHGAGVGTAMTADLQEPIEDGREAEGVSRLVCNDVVGLVNQLEAIQTQLNQAGVANVVQKPCVRPLTIAGE